jgi:2-methylcitrate dehydratase PrpD
MTMALALMDEPTSALHVYSEEFAARPDLVALRDKVASVIDDSFGYRGAGVTVHLSDGTAIHENFDVAVPESDLNLQEAKLVEKFKSLAIPVIGSDSADVAAEFTLSLEDQSDINALILELSRSR